MTTTLIATPDEPNHDRKPRTARRRTSGEGTLYQRTDGRWEGAAYVPTTDGQARRIRVYGKTRREAADKLTKKINDHRQKLPLPARDPALGDYLTTWLNHIAVHKVRPNTLARYRACLRLYFPAPLLKKKLSQLTAKDIRLWLDQLRVTCRCCALGTDTTRDPHAADPQKRPRCCALGRCCQRYLSPLTIQYIHALLRTALEHAVREDDLARNVARNVQVPVGRQQRTEPFSPAEARTFLDAAQGFRLHALFDLALRTGMRRGELLGLRWSDLDLTGGTLAIRQTLQYVPGTGLVITPTKTPSSERRIALPRETIASLTRHRAQQQADHTAAGPAWTETGLVFTTKTGAPLQPSNVNRDFHQLLRGAGLRKIRFHDLRHSCASLLLDQGVDLIVIKELLGHAHIAITADVYAHVRLRLQRDAIERMSGALDKQPEP
ncbi:tyrosine-type recombinase/integrase [Nonomuraea sp. NPDC048916]|uniref:tyrosine-type recombinase/integrase n=1 Tax=Nonomuraea sp. NPDC048916 TaxID=3154232 RepID=UPI0033E05172